LVFWGPIILPKGGGCLLSRFQGIFIPERLGVLLREVPFKAVPNSGGRESHSREKDGCRIFPFPSRGGKQFRGKGAIIFAGRRLSGDRHRYKKGKRCCPAYMILREGGERGNFGGKKLDCTAIRNRKMRDPAKKGLPMEWRRTRKKVALNWGRGGVPQYIIDAESARCCRKNKKSSRGGKKKDRLLRLFLQREGYNKDSELLKGQVTVYESKAPSGTRDQSKQGRGKKKKISSSLSREKKKGERGGFASHPRRKEGGISA